MVTMDEELMGEMHNVFLCFLPMFHVFGLAVVMCAQLQMGYTIVSMPKFDLDVALKSIEKYRVTHMWLVPPVMLALVKQGKLERYDISSLKHIGSGAAPLGKELMEECAKSLPHVAVGQVLSCKAVNKMLSDFQFQQLYCEILLVFFVMIPPLHLNSIVGLQPSGNWTCKV